MIIGIIGPKKSGKSTVARHIADRYGFVRRAFADPMKRSLMATFGLTWEQVYGSEKEIPTDKLCGRTPRYAMETMGTNWGRDMIHPDIWLRSWDTAKDIKGEPLDIDRHLRTAADEDSVIEDIRFPNEVHKVRVVHRGLIVSVRRPGYEYSSDHESESHSELPYDFKIENNGGIGWLKTQVDIFYNHFIANRVS